MTTPMCRAFRLAWVGTLVVVTGLYDAAATAGPTPFDWAYPYSPKLQPAPAEATPSPREPSTVAGRAFPKTADENRDGAAPPDGVPGPHPSIPEVVSHGTPSELTACAACHLADGQGNHGSINLAGLCAEYIVEQVKEFRSGRRRSADPRLPLVAQMVRTAHRINAEELSAAAEYYSELTYRPWIHVVESETVPATRSVTGGWFEPMQNVVPEAGRGRIVELEHDDDRYGPALGFVAYVPPASIKRGDVLAHAARHSAACGSCHGTDLRGDRTVPPLAGRSPSYLARQLWDIKSGHRRGPAVALMQAPLAHLSIRDITDLSAYLGSLPP